MKNQAISRSDPQQKGRKSAVEGGSVIFLILIAVALFAALSFVIMQSSRTGSSTLTEQQAKLMATEVMNYGRIVKDAVLALKIQGCAETQISFEHSATGSTYHNSNAPTDHKCDVFHPNGGNVKWIEPHESIKSSGSAFYQANYYFYSGTAWQGVGSTCTSDSCADLIMGLNMSITSNSEAVCKSINSSLGIAGIPEDSSWGGSAFTGTHEYSVTLGDEPEGTALIGKNEACISSPSVSYSYTKVLLAR